MKHTYVYEYPLIVDAYNKYQLIAQYDGYDLTFLKANFY